MGKTHGLLGNENSSGAGTRTPDTRIMIPLTDIGKSNRNKYYEDSDKLLGVLLVAFGPSIRAVDPDLADLLELWTELSEETRQGMLESVAEFVANSSE
jgi:hypothetical protein